MSEPATLTTEALPDDTHRPLKLLLVLAATIKLAYLIGYLELPFLVGPIFDAPIYLEQANAVLAGRFGDPTLVAYSPLFGWFAAALGARALLVVLGQFALGLGQIVLLHRIARRLVAPRIALASCVLLIGYGLPLSYESKMLSETLGLFLAMLTMERFTHPAFAEGSVRHAFATGAAFGFAVLARASVLFALPFFPFVALLAWTRGESIRVRARRASLFAAGTLLVFGANGTMNYANTGLFVPVIMVSRTLERTTARDFDGTLRNPEDTSKVSSPWDVVRQAEARIAASQRGEVDDGGNVASIDVVGVLVHAPRKLALTLRDHELTFDYAYYAEREVVPALGMLPFTFGGIEFLAVVGVIALIVRGRGREVLPHLPLVLGAIAVCLVYHPSSRYRLAMIVPMLSLASATFDGLLSLRRERERLAIASVVVAAPMLFFTGRLYTYQVRHPGTFEAIIAESYARAGDQAGARLHAQRALELEPDSEEVRLRLGTFLRSRPAPGP